MICTMRVTLRNSLVCDIVGEVAGADRRVPLRTRLCWRPQSVTFFVVFVRFVSSFFASNVEQQGQY